MIDIPFQCLDFNKWQAFKTYLPEGSSKQHRIVIITNYPQIQYLYVTSQISKAKLRCRKDISSLVELSPTDWPEYITKDCCIQCGRANLNYVDMETLQEIHKKYKIFPLGEIPDNLKTKIKAAICSSKTYTATEKKFYTL